MEIRQYQIDAFTDHVFGGNPAAVCMLDTWLPEETMQAIAAENNLSETAFCVARSQDDYDIRWFTPRFEIALAGHPTLATAWVVLNKVATDLRSVRFTSAEGEILTVVRDGDVLTMDFPAVPGQPDSETAAIAEALGAEPEAYLMARDAMAVFADAETVRNLQPDMQKVAAIDALGVIATAPGEDCDFVSRFFAPRAGIPEDPVTGSAHCTLVPYWAQRLGKTELLARQIDIFFYGLFMNREALSDQGFHPGLPAIACVEGFRLVIGDRATLAPDAEATVWGVVMALPMDEVAALYAERSVADYMPEAVLARSPDGQETAALCYNLPIAPSSETNTAYAEDLYKLAANIGLPADYISLLKILAT